MRSAQTTPHQRRPDVDTERAQAGRPKLLFVVTEDWYFLSHRLSVALAAQRAGYDVAVATRIGAAGAQIAKAGLRSIPLQYLYRRSRNPWTELRAIGELTRIYRRECPQLVHHVALKPVIYGGIAARLAGVPSAVNALAGLGFVFSSRTLRARLFAPVVRAALRLALALGRSALILQNPDDRNLLIAHRVIAAQRVHLIRGVGADVAVFVARPAPPGTPLVTLASRMLWDKGVGDFVDMAQQLRAAGVAARFALVGESDPGNPTAVPAARLRAWHEAGVVEWWGKRDDMPQVYAQSAIVCLPTTYGEGVPKVLLEAAACGRPIVAYDVPGCREIVRHDENGLLVTPRAIGELADAVARLLASPERRAAMGAKGRAIVLDEFTEAIVIGQTLRLYQEMLQTDDERNSA